MRANVTIGNDNAVAARNQ